VRQVTEPYIRWIHDCPSPKSSPLSDEVDRALWQERILAVLASAFGILSAVIAGVGLYGMISYSVTRQRHSIAVRIAVGADPLRIAWPLFGQTLVILAVGAAIGRLMQPILYGVGRADFRALGLTAPFILITAGTALAVPVRSALGTDSAKMLRSDAP
jgi:ABC-type antimicrobial peptide transport system permease subunit